MTDKIVILSTCETKADARKIATHLVEERLAACVNMLPNVTSIYRWKGAVEAAEEYMLVIKSRRALVGAIEEAFREIHPYKVPELIVLPIEASAAAYLAWLDESLAS